MKESENRKWSETHRWCNTDFSHQGEVLMLNSTGSEDEAPSLFWSTVTREKEYTLLMC